MGNFMHRLAWERETMADAPALLQASASIMVERPRQVAVAGPPRKGTCDGHPNRKPKLARSQQADRQESRCNNNIPMVQAKARIWL